MKKNNKSVSIGLTVILGCIICFWLFDMAHVMGAHGYITLGIFIWMLGYGGIVGTFACLDYIINMD